MTMTIRPIVIMVVVLLWLVVAASITSARAAETDAPLPALPHTVGMRGPDVDLIETGIAAFSRGELAAARSDFEQALAIRSQTAVATFNLGVTEFRLGKRGDGERLMQRGLQLAHDHGMTASPQAASMRAIAHALGVDLD